MLNKEYQGLPGIRNLPWIIKWMIYIGSLILLSKACLYFHFSFVIMFFTLVPGMLVLLHILGPPKENANRH
jgi:hypothetical protein